MRGLRILAATAMIGAAVPASADMVSDWAELQTSVHTASEDPQGSFDPDKIQAFGKVALAMFEAANAAQPRYQSYLKLAPGPAGASADAAIAQAAHDVLVKLYPGQIQTISDNLLVSLSAVPAGKPREDGIELGRRAAAAALAAGGVDPALPLGVYRPAGLPGKWAPSQVPFHPKMVAARPWFMSSASQFRLPPPVDLKSAAWAASFDEVKRLGAKESKERSAAETVKARFWAFYNLDPALRQIAGQPGRTPVQNARMYALLYMAADDMDIVLADGKTAHMFWRPLNAIRTADQDGNDATAPDLTWEPLLRTPNQPEYPCGHCTFANLVSTILTAEGPPPAGGIVFTNDRMPGVRLTVPDFPAYARDVSLSRIHAGVHFRASNEVSDALGRRIAEYAMARFAPPLAK